MPAELPQTVLGGRYRLDSQPFDRGGTGTVYQALDLITGASVAVKILAPQTTSAALRQRREVLALRVLQTPGVVRLHDEGTTPDGRPFIVMELIDGRPFPGNSGFTWGEIGPTTLALLETLARVHAAGIIHRDLKPANVLVDDAGRPTLLDFGLARGEPLGLDITRPDSIVGTPRYSAPEQLVGTNLDPRTDLYAVGLMLYETLAQNPPHPLDNREALMAARVWKDAPPLEWAAPEVPREVCQVVDRLLARLPDARPRSATEVLLELRAIGPDEARVSFPWLGTEAPIRAALDAARRNASMDFAAAPGSGRTRCLTEISANLARSGRRSAWTRRGRRPYDSLRPVVGEPSTVEVVAGAPSPPVAPAAIEKDLESRLRETLAGGTVLLVDDADELDPWSARLIDAARAHGPVIRAFTKAPGPAWPLVPLPPAALKGLFHGPDRLLHLRDDAAAALHARTGGLPRQVVAEVSAWVGAGLASWKDGRVRVDRAALDRLEGGVVVQVPPPPMNDRKGIDPALEEMLAWIRLAWPHGSPELLSRVTGVSDPWEIELVLVELERVGAVVRSEDGRLEPRQAALALETWGAEKRREAHAALAGALPPGATGRFSHLVGAGDLVAAAAEGRVIARRLAADGYLGRAMGVLIEALPLAREAGDHPGESALLVELAKIALTEGTDRAIKQAHYETARAGWDDGTLGPLKTLLELGLARNGEAMRSVSARAGELPAFADPELAVWVNSVELSALFGLERYEDADRLLQGWLAGAEGDVYRRSKVLNWFGLLRYRQGRFGEAADFHLRALPLREDPADRISAMLNGASALLEAQRLEEAMRWAGEALELAERHRLTLAETRATWLLRCAAYRAGTARAPDLELSEAVTHVDARGAEALVLMNEATIAWRHGHRAHGARMARRAEALHAPPGRPDLRAVAQALAMLCEGVDDPEVWWELATRALDLPAFFRATVLGLVACARVVWDPAWLAVVEESLTAHPAPVPSQPRVVLADDEIVLYARNASARFG